MKILLKPTAFLLFITISFSCSNTDEVCYGCQDDTIGLSKKQVNFSAESNSTTITTQGSDWSLAGVTFKGTHLDVSGVNSTAKEFKIEEAEYTVERKNANELFIQMSKNNSGQARKLSIFLMHLNRGDYIDINQLAK